MYPTSNEGREMKERKRSGARGRVLLLELE
jgi:hypothetical protein